MQQRSKVTKMVLFSLMGVIAFLIESIRFPLPTFPAFLEVDFSEVPALITAIIFGPFAGILIELIKNILHLFIAGGNIVGIAANFIAGSIFISITATIYRRFPGWKGFALGFLSASIIMAIFMSIANYFVLLPLYAKLANFVVEGQAKLNLVMYGIAPFNIIKGILISLVFIPFYLKIVPYLKNRYTV